MEREREKGISAYALALIGAAGTHTHGYYCRVRVCRMVRRLRGIDKKGGWIGKYNVQSPPVSSSSGAGFQRWGRNSAGGAWNLCPLDRQRFNLRMTWTQLLCHSPFVFLKNGTVLDQFRPE